MRCAGGGASAILIAISVMPNMPRLSSATEPIVCVSRTLGVAARKIGKKHRMTGLSKGAAVLGKRSILPCAITYDITERFPSAKRRSIGCED
jgi:hypothetical protein